MKDKKKGQIIFAIVVVLIVAVCLIVQFVLNKDTERLKEEGKKYETLTVETKSGKVVETEYTHIENEEFYFKVPKEFKALDVDTINQKYSGNVPDVVFSNDDTTINLAISMTENKMSDSEIKQYREYMENILKSQAEILESKDETIEGHSIGKIRLISEATDTKIYNNMLFFSYHDNLVIITFNCTEELQDEWSEVGDFLIDSLFFGENE